MRDFKSAHQALIHLLWEKLSVWNLWWWLPLTTIPGTPACAGRWPSRTAHPVPVSVTVGPWSQTFSRLLGQSLGACALFETAFWQSWWASARLAESSLSFFQREVKTRLRAASFVGWLMGCWPGWALLWRLGFPRANVNYPPQVMLALVEQAIYLPGCWMY